MSTTVNDPVGAEPAAEGEQVVAAESVERPETKSATFDFEIWANMRDNMISFHEVTYIGQRSWAWSEPQTDNLFAEIVTRSTTGEDRKPLGACVRLYLEPFVPGTKVRCAVGEGETARAAYRDAWRNLRMAKHTVPDLLRQLASVRRGSTQLIEISLTAARGAAEMEAQRDHEARAFADTVTDLLDRRARVLRRADTYRVRIRHLEKRLAEEGTLHHAANTAWLGAEKQKPDALDAVTLVHLRAGWVSLDQDMKARYARQLVDDLCKPYSERSMAWQLVTAHLRK